ncbi:MAG TPA: transposase [Burkholderiales bacterium]|nr:transposase [Burkholderiales bacterium]
MSHISFGDEECCGERKKTRREAFLNHMEQAVPWHSLLMLIEPFCLVAGRDRPPYPLATMLRVYMMQEWFVLSDLGTEDALYDSASIRQFARLTLAKPIPDEKMIMNFRRVLEENNLAAEVLSRLNRHLSGKGLLVKRGSIVDPTIIAAPNSPTNAEAERNRSPQARE